MKRKQELMDSESAARKERVKAAYEKKAKLEADRLILEQVPPDAVDHDEL